MGNSPLGPAVFCDVPETVTTLQVQGQACSAPRALSNVLNALLTTTRTQFYTSFCYKPWEQPAEWLPGQLWDLQVVCFSMGKPMG